MHTLDESMQGEPELAKTGLTQLLGVHKAMPRDVLCRAEGVSSFATVTTIQNTPRKGRGSFR
jgi:hypothetical protein